MFQLKLVTKEMKEEDFDHSDEEDYVYEAPRSIPSEYRISVRDKISSQISTIGDHNLSDSRITDSYNTLVTHKHSYKYIHQTENSSGLLKHTRDQPPRHYAFKINNFSSLLESHVKKVESGVFHAGGYKWKLILHPNGNEKAGGGNHISLYLAIEDTTSLPPGFEVNVDMRVFVMEQLQGKFLAVQDAKRPMRIYNKNRTVLGFAKFLSLKIFRDENNGYLYENSCVFGIEVFVAKSTRKCDNLLVIDNTVKLLSSDLKEYSSNRSVALTFKPKEKELAPHESRDSSSQLNESQGIIRTTRDYPPAHIFQIKSFSSLHKNKIEKHNFDTFEVGDLNWRLCLYPNGCKKRNGSGHISLYLKILKEATFPSHWEVNVDFKMFVLDQIRNKYHSIQDVDGVPKCFNKITKKWGFAQLISWKTFNNPENGFLVNDCCIFGVEIFVVRHMCNNNIIIKNPANCNTYTWPLYNFSTLNLKKYDSETFTICGRKWVLAFYPKGDNTVEHSKWLSLYLRLTDRKSIPVKQESHVNYSLRIRDQVNHNHFQSQLTYKFINPSRYSWGYGKFMSLQSLHDQSKGYICKDTLIVEVIFTSIVVHDVLLET